MKTAVVPRYGNPDVIRFERAAIPEVSSTDVLIEVHATAVTQGDRRMRAGDFPGITALLGRLMMGFGGPRKRVPGSTFAGRIVRVGRDVTEFSVGDDVFGECMSGGCAEKLVMPASGAISRVPRGLSFTEVAALPYSCGTANSFLNDLCELQADEHVVIVGAGGGVGRYAVQNAAATGAKVTAVCSQRHHQLVRELGADEVVLPGEAVHGNVDVVFDTSGTSSLSAWRDQMPPTGRFATTDLTSALLRDLFLGLFRKGPNARFMISVVDARQLARVVEQVESGQLRPVLGPVFEFSDLIAAHRCLEDDRPQGDVVVRLLEEARPTIGRVA